MKKTLFLILLLNLCCSLFAQTLVVSEKANDENLANYTVTNDVAYGSNPEQKMDLYLAKDAEKLGAKNSAIVFLHGGGWYMSDKTDVKSYILPYLNKGYNVINLNYRLKKGVPVAAEDLSLALNYLQTSDTYKIHNLGKVILSGFSSGGHIAALVGLSANNKRYKNRLNKGIRIKAIIDFSGPTDQLDVVEKRFIDWKLAISESLSTSDIGNAMFPAEGYVSRDSITEYEPITYWDEKDPPFFLWYGWKDDQVFPSTFENFVKLLNQDMKKNVVVFGSEFGHSPKKAELSEAYKQIFLFLEGI